MQDAEELWLQTFSAYRIQFACVHVGKYTPKSKRKVMWHFGLKNVASLQSGKVGSDCAVEEIKIQLIWSIVSGRIQVLWNDRDITHIFPTSALKRCSRCCGSAPVAQLDWKLPSGRTFQILAHSVALAGVNQYDLLIDGQSFFTLPVASQLGNGGYTAPAKYTPVTSKILHEESYCVPNYIADIDSKDSCDSDIDEVFENFEGDVKYNTKCSLDYHHTPSMDLHVIPPSHQDDIKFVRQYQCPKDELCQADELQSNSYKVAHLETLRNDVTSLIPCAESIMSQAIIAAFSEERLFSLPQMASSTKDEASDDAIRFETYVMWRTCKWLELNGRIRHTTHFHREKIAFIQSEVNNIVMNVRYKLLSPSAASRIIHSLAAMLSLDLAVPLPQDTIILTRMRKSVTCNHLRNYLKECGDIKAVGVQRGQHGFGICRFRTASAVRRAVESSRKNKLMIQDVYPLVFEPSSLMQTKRFDMQVHDINFVTQIPIEIATVHQQHDRKERGGKDNQHKQNKNANVSNHISTTISSTHSFIQERTMGSHILDFDSRRSQIGGNNVHSSHSRHTQSSFDNSDLGTISVIEIDDGSSCVSLSELTKYSVTTSTMSTAMSTVVEDDIKYII